MPIPATEMTIDIKNIQPTKFICEPLELTAGTLNTLVGQGCSSKTLLAQLLATCVSTGTPFFGSEVAKGRVVHVDQEMTQDEIAKRYFRIHRGLNVKPGNIYRTKLIARLDDGEKGNAEFDGLREMVAGATLVIIDCLKALTVEDENSCAIELLLRRLQNLAHETGACILVVHHKGKTTGSARASGRGHSSIYDVPTMQIDLDCDPVKKTYTLYGAKWRHKAIGDGSITYRIKDAGASLSALGHREKDALEFELVSETDELQKVFDAVKANPGASQNKIEKATGLNNRKVSDLIKSLLEDDKIENRGTDKSYRLHAKVWEENSLLRKVA